MRNRRAAENRFSNDILFTAMASLAIWLMIMLGFVAYWALSDHWSVWFIPSAVCLYVGIVGVWIGFIALLSAVVQQGQRPFLGTIFAVLSALLTGYAMAVGLLGCRVMAVGGSGDPIPWDVMWETVLFFSVLYVPIVAVTALLAGFASAIDGYLDDDGPIRTGLRIMASIFNLGYLIAGIVGSDALLHP